MMSLSSHLTKLIIIVMLVPLFGFVGFCLLWWSSGSLFYTDSRGIGTGAIAEIVMHDSVSSEAVSAKVKALFVGRKSPLSADDFMEKLKSPSVRCREKDDSAICIYNGFRLIETDQVYGFIFVKKIPADVSTIQLQIIFAKQSRNISTKLENRFFHTNSYIQTSTNEKCKEIYVSFHYCPKQQSI